MLVKNFLLLSALAVAVVSAADKQTSLRHKEAGRGLKKDEDKDKDKKENKNKDKDKKENEGSGNELNDATSRFNICSTQTPTFDFTAYAEGGTFNPVTSGFIVGVGSTGANGEFVASGCDTMTIDVDAGGGDEELIEVNRVAMNTACARDDKCCSFHSDCESGCCAGWYGCVKEGTAAYKVCGSR